MIEAKWKLVPPSTAAVNLVSDSNELRDCNIYMCATDTDCEEPKNVLGPIEADKCDVGVMRSMGDGGEAVQTIFGAVSVRC